MDPQALPKPLSCDESPGRRRFAIQVGSLLFGLAGSSCARNEADKKGAAPRPDPDKDPRPGPSVDAAPEPKLPGTNNSSPRLGAPWPDPSTHTAIDKTQIDFGPLPQRCELLTRMTEGPCTTAVQIHRADIREGWKGLPIQLDLRLVDHNCIPLKQASVRIWHTNFEGSYSGQTPANDFCVFKKEYLQQNFCRGEQRSDDHGIVRFLTNYPGWYPGRAIHIHIQVSQDGYQSRATQLYFPASLNQAVFATHPIYQPRNPPDTSNAKDSIMQAASSSQQEALTLDIHRTADRRIFAFKTLAILKA